MTPEEVIAAERAVWTRSAPADLYYTRDPARPATMQATPKSLGLQRRFEEKLIETGRAARAQQPAEPQPRPRQPGHTHHHHSGDSSEDSSGEEEEDPAQVLG